MLAVGLAHAMNAIGHLITRADGLQGEVDDFARKQRP